MSMRFDIVTIFPELIETFSKTGIIAKSIEKNLLDVRIHNPRNFSPPPHKVMDDYPYGGGPGMVMKPEPIIECVESIEGFSDAEILITDPTGGILNQKAVAQFEKRKHIIIICGRYEGVDERVKLILKAKPVSIGPYVMMGGEIAALAIIESVSRLVPGILGNSESIIEESYSSGFLEYPQYTRPRDYRGYSVPDVLLSGNHQEIEKFRKEKSIRLKD